MLEEYSKATVSLEEEPLQNAAKKALIDASYFEQIQDYSRATDLVGNKESNIYNDMLQNTEMENAQKQLPISKATTSKIVFENMSTN